MLGNISFGELMIVLSIILLLFGAKRLPELARSLGKSIFEFKRGMNSAVSDIIDVLESEQSLDQNAKAKLSTEASQKSTV